MAIATVTRTAGATQNEDTYAVSLSPSGHAVLQRWAQETGRTRANQLEDVIQRYLAALVGSLMLRMDLAQIAGAASDTGSGDARRQVHRPQPPE